MLEEKLLFLALESRNPGARVSVVSSSQRGEKKAPFKVLNTFSGNILLVISEGFFGGELDSFKVSGSLRFSVEFSEAGSQTFVLRASVGSEFSAQLGEIYTSSIDPGAGELVFALHYDGGKVPALRKLRFQLTSVRNESKYGIEAVLESPKGEMYTLNSIFQRAVGGILSEPTMSLCKTERCEYKLRVTSQGVKIMNIESFLVEEFESLSIHHYDEYYDRAYEAGQVIQYELPFDPVMEGMDVSVSLVTVTGEAGLFINAHSRPRDLTTFDWKETGPLGKRITVGWAELVSMRAERKSLFIAVKTETPGELLLKIDAHEPGSRGRLSPGVVESGFVEYDKVSNYLYQFDVFGTQEVRFDLHLTITSGDANLYVRQCSGLTNCRLAMNDLQSTEVVRVEDNQPHKALDNLPFTCKGTENSAGSCQFAVGVRGKENHGTHFELTLHERRFHRLLVPGHAVSLSLGQNEQRLFKFSRAAMAPGELALSVEALWGSFELFLSRTSQFPSKDDNIYRRSFHHQAGLSGALSTLNLAEVANFSSGPMFLSIQTESACSLSLKLIERSSNRASVHAISAGSPVRGELRGSSDVAYYAFRSSLQGKPDSMITVALTPLKGSFVMFAERNGKLPSPDSAEYFSENNSLELALSNAKQPEEFIVGVRLAKGSFTEDNSYQFSLSVLYSSKPMRMIPGLISTFTASETNVFLIEVKPEMKNILILKSVVDGFNINLCATIVSSPEGGDRLNCKYSANDKAVSTYIPDPELRDTCEKLGSRCFVLIKISASANQKFSVGYTFNEHPFTLVKNLVLTGPLPLQKSQPLRLIYHPQSDSPLVLHFDAKGGAVKIYTRLRRADNAEGESEFPNAAAFDAPSQTRKGYVTDILYDVAQLSTFGKDPELLITISADESTGNEPGKPFEPNHHFVLQSSVECKELMRTQTLSSSVQADTWSYYTFYNNGNSDSLSVYVTTSTHAKITAVLARGQQARPPFTSRPLLKKTGLGAVELNVTSEEAKRLDSKSLRDHFTLGVLSSNNGVVSLYWNNKEELNFLELTPNEPSTMQLARSKTLYFSLFAHELDSSSKRDSLFIYIQASVQAEVHLLKTGVGQLDAPSATNSRWHSRLSAAGGVARIEIKPTDPDYCLECTYMGVVTHSEPGTFTLLAVFRHDGLPVSLNPGFTLPEMLPPGGRAVFRLSNPDAQSMDISVSMMSGFVEAFIDSSPDVSEAKHKEHHSLETALDSHTFLVLDPAAYEVKEAHDYYLLLVNKRNDPASFTLHLDKNSVLTPLVPGITRFFQLAPGETADFSLRPASTGRVELRFELRRLLGPEPVDAKTAIMALESFVELRHLNERGDRYPLQIARREAEYNRLFITLDLPAQEDGSFLVLVKNPLNRPVAVALDLAAGSYKLVNQNEHSIDKVEASQPLVFEAYTIPDKYFFVDLKICSGDVKVSFEQDAPGSQSTAEYKTVRDKHSFTHYIKPSSERVFFSVANAHSDFSVFHVSFFTEDNVETSPYSEVIQGNLGKVSVELESGLLVMSPIRVKSSFAREFTHIANYTVYLSSEYQVTSYAKNCGRYMIGRVFDTPPHLLSFSSSFVFKSIGEIENFKEKIKIAIKDLLPNTKYYGVVVATLELFPPQQGYLTPIRTARSYYDEFVFVTARYDIPYNLIISSIVLFGFFFCLVCVVRAYIFGRLKMASFEKFSGLTFDEGVLGFNALGILDKEDENEESEPISNQPAPSTSTEMTQAPPAEGI